MLRNAEVYSIFIYVYRELYVFFVNTSLFVILKETWTWRFFQSFKSENVKGKHKHISIVRYMFSSAKLSFKI